MRQKYKKFFKILPWSVVGLMVLVLVAGSWQIFPAKMAKAAAINAASKIDVTPGTQFTTFKGVPVYRLHVTNTGDAADAITSLSPTPSGSVNDTLITLHFYKDVNDNGIVDQGDTDLGASAAFAVDDTIQTFDITDVTVPATGSVSILITADGTGALLNTETFTLKFAAGADILMTNEPTGAFPLTNANALTISTSVPSLTIADAASDPATKTIAVGATNVAVKRLAISAAAGTSDSIVSLAPTPTGTATDNTDITSVVFYIDSGTTAGAVDGSDVQLVATPATYTADNTQTIFTFSSPVQIAASSTVNILIVYNISVGITPGDTLYTSIAAVGDVVAGSGTALNADTSTTSALITIAGPNIVIASAKVTSSNTVLVTFINPVENLASVDFSKWHIDVGDGGLTPLNPTSAAVTSAGTPWTITLTFAGTPFSNTATAFSAAEGLYVDALGVTDTAGDTNVVVVHSASTTITDGQVPIITSTAPAIGAYIKVQEVNYALSEAVASGVIVFTRTAGTDIGGVHTCTLQGNALNTGAHSNLALTTGANACAAWTALVDGATYTVTFDATDAASNAAATISNTGVVYDTSPPTIGAVSITPVDRFFTGVPNYTNTNIYVTATVTDVGGVTGCEYTKDGATWVAATWLAGTCTSPYINAGISTFSVYNFNIRGTDNAGNVGTGTQLTATGDINNPVVVLGSPSDGATTNANPSFTYTPSDVGSGLAKCDFYWNYPAGGAITLAGTHLAPVDSALDTFSFPGSTTEGTFTWDVACTDNVGSVGWGNWPAHRTITIDNTAPILQSFTSSTGNNTFGPTGSINITATYNEPLAVGSSITVTLDTGAPVTLNNVAGSTLWGTYVVGATGSLQNSTDLTVSSINVESAVDAVGNTRINSTVPGAPNNIANTSNIVVDTTAPTVVSAITRDGNGDGQIDSITVTYNEPVNDPDYDMIDVGRIMLPLSPFNGGTGTTTLVYNYAQNGSPDTGATLSLTWTDIGADAADLAGNLLDISTAPAVSTDGAKPVVVSAKITAPNTITVVYSEAVSSISTDYTNLVLTAGGARAVTGSGGTGTNTIFSSISGAPMAVNETGTMDIAGTVADLSPALNSLTAVVGQIVTDGQAPIVNSITPAPSTITDLNVGTATFSVSVVYDEPMDLLSTPTITFTPDLVFSGTLTLNAGSLWTDNYTYLAFYDVADNDETLTGIGIGVTGATDVAGNTQSAGSSAAAFNIDTENPTVVSATTSDADGNGQIDQITVVYSDDVDDADYNAIAPTGYPVNVGASSGTGSTTLVYVLTESGSPDTNTTPPLNWTAANATDLVGNDLDLISVVPPPNATDGAAPVITNFDYQDIDHDGKIDRFVLSYSEPAVAASTLSADNLNLFANGGFTGAGFGSDATDLIVGLVSSTAVDLGTEAAGILTHNSSPIRIFTQGGGIPFSLRDAGGNINNAGVEQTQASYTDLADPIVITAGPLSGATGVATNADIAINFSESMNTGTVTQTSLPDPGGWSTTWTNFNATVYFSHAAFLNNTLYTEQITAGQDGDGNALAGSLVPNPWTFTTAAGSGGGSFPPTCQVVINNGASGTNNPTVNLSISSNQTVTEMAISNDSGFSTAVFEPYASTKYWMLDGTYGTKTVYVIVRAAGLASNICSDTIEYMGGGGGGGGTGTPTPPTPPATTGNLVLHDPTPAPPLPPNVEIGTLVKRADMSSVYFIDQDNRRHAFPNGTVYLSWFTDFSNVKTISAETLAQIPLGTNVFVRPGTYLVKIQSDPKVYAVEPYGVLRWVSTEAIANSLYGPDWNKKIIDVDPTFFMNYQVGSDITTATHPTGSVIQYAGTTALYYIDNGASRLIAPGIFGQDLFQNKFVLSNISSSISYSAGADFPVLPIETLMTLR
jgi:hypothetical protein